MDDQLKTFENYRAEPGGSITAAFWNGMQDQAIKNIEQELQRALDEVRDLKAQVEESNKSSQFQCHKPIGLIQGSLVQTDTGYHVAGGGGIFTLDGSNKNKFKINFKSFDAIPLVNLTRRASPDHLKANYYCRPQISEITKSSFSFDIPEHVAGTFYAFDFTVMAPFT